MKKILFLLSVAIAFAFISCTKETEKQYLQPHDENEVMMSLHELIGSTYTISFSKGLESDFIDVMQTLHHGGLHMADIMFHESKDNSLCRLQTV